MATTGFTASSLTDAVNGQASAATYISMHTGDPAGTGANEVTGGSYARQQTTWAAASGSGPVTRAGSQVTVPIPASTTISYWGLWTAATGGAFKGAWALTAPETFGSAGSELFTPTLSQSN